MGTAIPGGTAIRVALRFRVALRSGGTAIQVALRLKGKLYWNVHFSKNRLRRENVYNSFKMRFLGRVPYKTADLGRGSKLTVGENHGEKH